MEDNKNNVFGKIGIVSIVLYSTLHLLEEGLFGFPAWAENSWGMPDYTVERWLTHNFFFLGTLLSAYLIYVFSNGEKVVLILGIVMWGVINTLNHSVFTLIQLKYSPGLFTGFLFLFLLYWVIKELKKHNILNRLIIAKGIGIGVLLWLIPIILFLLFDIFVIKVV